MNNVQAAEQSRKKIIQIKAQLSKAQNQLSADILSNALWKWESELATTIAMYFEQGSPAQPTVSNSLSSLSRSATTRASISMKRPGSKKALLFIDQFLSLTYHVSFIKLIQSLPDSLVDSVVKSLLLLWPYELPEVPKSPLGFDAIFKRMPKQTLSQLDQRNLEFTRSLVAMALLDAIVIATEKNKGNNLLTDTIDHLTMMAFNFLKQPFTRKLSPEYSGKIADAVIHRWALTIGNVSRTEYQLQIRLVYEMVDPKRVNSDETLLCLHALRYIEITPSNESNVSEIRNLIGEIVSLVEKTKKPAIAISAIHTLEHIVQQLDFTQPREAIAAHKVPMVKDMSDLFLRAWKWAGNDELKAHSVQLMAVILVNSDHCFYEENFTPYMNEFIYSQREKKRAYIFKSVLQILRGRYYADSRKNCIARMRGAANGIKESWTSPMRPQGQEPTEKTLSRARELCEYVFDRRKSLIPTESLGTVSQILLQVGAIDMVLAKSVLIRLLSDGEGFVPELCLVAVKALQTFLNPQREFAYHAAFIQKANLLQDGLKGLIPALKEGFNELIQVCDQYVGTFRLGKTSSPYEVSPVDNKTRADDEIGVNVGVGLFDDSSESSQKSLASEAIMMAEEDIQMHKLLINEIEGRARCQSQPEIYLLRESPGFNTVSNKTDTHVERAVNEWHQVLSIEPVVVRSDALAAQSLGQRASKKAKIKGAENALVLTLLKETFNLVQFVPTSAIMTGKAIYYNLLHRSEEISTQLSQTLQAIFGRSKEARVTVLYGLVDMLQIPDFQDEICSQTILNHIVHFTGAWLDDLNIGSIPKDSMLQLSDKMDGVLFNELIRSDPKLRSLALRSLKNYFQVMLVHPQITFSGASKAPVWYIIENMADNISRKARKGYMMKYTLDECLITPDIPLISIEDAANSGINRLWIYYLGDIATAVEQKCRAGTLKYLINQLKYRMTSWITSPDFDSFTVTGLFVVFQVFCGQKTIFVQDEAGNPPEMKRIGSPLKEVAASPTTPLRVTNSLYNHVRDTLKEILFSNDKRYRKELLFSFVFTHKDMIRPIMMDIGTWSKEEERGFHQGDGVLKRRLYVRNVLVKYLFQITRNSNFYEFVSDRALGNFESPSGISSEISEFLMDIERDIFDTTMPLNDFPFKAAFKYCSIVARTAASLSFCLISLNATSLSTEDVLQTNWRKTVLMDKDAWSIEARLRVIMHLYGWTNLLAPYMTGKSPNPSSVANKPHYAPAALKNAINLAVEKVVALGDLFSGDMPPDHLLNWFELMEYDGFKIFCSLLKNSFNTMIDWCLTKSYSENEATSVAFFKVIHDYLDPRPWRERLRFEKISDKTEALSEYSTVLSSWVAHIEGSGGREDQYMNMNDGYTVSIMGNVRAWNGALFFWALYNTMHTSQWIRNQSFWVIERLFRLFENFSNVKNEEVRAFFEKHKGLFHTKIGRLLRPEIMDISRVSAKIFSEYSGQYITEAIKCSRIAEKYPHTQRKMLVREQSFIFDLQIAWVHNARFDLGTLENPFNELLSYMFDVTFYFDLEQTHMAWKEVAMPPHGHHNVPIIIEFILQIAARCPRLTDSCMDVALKLCDIHPDLVIQIFVDQIVNPDVSSTGQIRKTAASIYVSALYKHLYKEELVPLKSEKEDQELRAKAAITILGEIVLQHFELLKSKLPMIVNYCLLHLPTVLVELSLSRRLLYCIAQGCLAYHKNRHGPRQTIENERVLVMFKSAEQLITILQLPYHVYWDDPDKHANANSLLRSDIDEVLAIRCEVIVNSICLMLNLDHDRFVQELADEALSWGSNKDVDREISSRAIYLYSILIQLEEMPIVIDGIQSRLIDNLSAFEPIQTVPPSSLPGVTSDPKEIIENLICSILHLHGTLIQLYSDTPIIAQVPILLFTSMCVLLTTFRDDFKNIYKKALKNCLLFFADENKNELTNVAEKQEFKIVFGKISSSFPGLHEALLPAILSKEDKEVSFNSILFLVEASCFLPDQTVNPYPSAYFYTITYSIMWIFTRLLTKKDFDTNKVQIKKLATRMCESIKKRKVRELMSLEECFRHVQNKEIWESQAVVFGLLERFTAALIVSYVPSYAGNIADIFNALIKSSIEYQQLIIQMLKFIWYLQLRQTKAFDPLMKRLPFIQAPEAPEITDLLCHTIKDCAQASEDVPVIDVDLITSTIKPYEFPEFIPNKASIEVVIRCLQNLSSR